MREGEDRKENYRRKVTQENEKEGMVPVIGQVSLVRKMT